MSLYRQAETSRTRRVVIGCVIGLALLGAGYGVGRATAPSASLEDNVASIRDDARVITDALELVPLHYESSNETTREGARDQIRRAIDRFRALEADLALLGSRATAEAANALDDVQRLAERNAAPADVEAAATRARDAVRAAAHLT